MHVLVTGLQTKARWRLPVAHAISTTCSLCWTSLCAACLYIIIRPDSQFLCTRVHILCDFLGLRFSHILMTVKSMYLLHVLHVFLVRLAPQCRAFSSIDCYVMGMRSKYRPNCKCNRNPTLSPMCWKSIELANS